MKTKFIAIICMMLLSFNVALAQENKEIDNFAFGQVEHLLDGCSLNYQYQNSTAIHLEFYDGKVSYVWIAGPKKGHGNKDVPYSSKKIGTAQYLVTWHEVGLKDYLTFVFDFDAMVVHVSGIVGYENRPERTLKTLFKSAIISHLKKAK